MQTNVSAGGPGRRRRWPALALLPGLVGLVAGITYSLAATAYPVGTLGSPGPGFFPALVGALLMVSSVLCLLGERRRPSPPPVAPGADFWRVPALTLAIAGYVALLKPLGFWLAASGLWAATLSILDRRPWWLAALSGLAAGGATYLLFQFLGVPLPRGPLPF